ncbi:hypothetical protein TSUD_208880 [Trifolium subterraneum]|uniref:C2 domain-containing protein n=1 Tax=Trifolium subterraneum TaxID=3900 RepID=A0A2Z6N987_TRISU|nr:hypothetical protein TSUD_208880 [Trifolium subterraneum]
MNTMTTPFQQGPPQTVRRLAVEVVDARNLLPKDGQGSSSPYVVADFDGQRKRTTTRFKELNPVWNESLEFIVSDPENMEFEELEVEVYNDKKFGNGSGRKNHFLGRVKLYGTQFSGRGEEALVYYTLEKKSVFSWVRGEIGLKIYYYDEMLQQEEQQQQQQEQQPPPEEERHGGGNEQERNRPPMMVEEGRVFQVSEQMEHCVPLPDGPPSPRVVVMEESPSPVVRVQQDPPLPEMYGPREPEMQYHHQPEVRKMQAMRNDRVKIMKRPNGGGDYAPKDISGKKPNGESDRIHPYDLVEPMQYLFVRIVKVRGLNPPTESPFVKVRTSSHYVRSKPASYRPNEPNDSPEWNQVFALGYNKTDATGATLEISVWDSPAEQFLGGVCFDLSDVPIRDSPDSPLAPQWYRLEGGAAEQNSGRVSGDIQLSVWIGTQSDDAFPEAWSSDAPYVAHTRSKVYQSPKLWYLRVVVMEAQDLNLTPNLPPLTAPEIRVKVQLGFQSQRTRRGSMNHHSMSFHWHEDLLFVAGEPLEDSMVLLVEDRTTKEAALLGHVVIPLTSIEQRIDDRHVPAKWFPLEGGTYCGRVHLRLCLEGGYHVLDEAAHVCSDFRPTAKSLWKPPVGILELGILGARGLLPMKSKGPGKGSTDAYCVAKYGKKWVRTRTVTDSFDPRWNEQYTWQVYDPCTVLTVGVFDNWRMFADVSEERPDCRIGKIRIRVSTLESNKIYTSSYPLLVLTRTGLKKMGEIELAVRFACPSFMPDTPKIPAGMDTRLSQAEAVDPDELDEEFDTMPSSKPPDLVRIRYDRLRMLAARVQTVLGDFATQGERVQALVSWRDPRATKLFIGVCFVVAIILYSVPPKMVAVALGFYYLRHPMFRNPMPPASLNFFRRLPSLSDRLM